MRAFDRLIAYELSRDAFPHLKVPSVMSGIFEQETRTSSNCMEGLLCDNWIPIYYCGWSKRLRRRDVFMECIRKQRLQAGLSCESHTFVIGSRA
jgi:hypothetical protein